MQVLQAPYRVIGVVVDIKRYDVMNSIDHWFAPLMQAFLHYDVDIVECSEKHGEKT